MDKSIKITDDGRRSLAEIQKIIKESWGEDMVQPKNTDPIIIDHISKLK